LGSIIYFILKHFIRRNAFIEFINDSKYSFNTHMLIIQKKYGIEIRKCNSKTRSIA